MSEALEAIFVTLEKRAASTALAELGRCRVAHPFDLWIHLRKVGRLTDGQFAELSEPTLKKEVAPGAMRVLSSTRRHT